MKRYRCEELVGCKNSDEHETANFGAADDPVGNVTKFYYDQLDRTVAEEITVDSQTLTRGTEYDLAGNVIRTIDRQGRVKVYEYDSLHRQIQEVWYASLQDAQTASNPLNTISTGYDIASRLTSIGDDNSSYGKRTSPPFIVWGCWVVELCVGAGGWLC